MMEEQRAMAVAEKLIKQTNDASKMIWVTFRKEGIHMYPGADTDPKLATGDWDDVSFLGVPHRHIFHFKVWIEIFHDDRDIEFIQFKRWLQRLYDDVFSEDLAEYNSVLELDHKSCEMISNDLFLQIAQRYPGRNIWIDISEDGENGSFIKYDKEN
jgi:hypothetical protein